MTKKLTIGIIGAGRIGKVHSSSIMNFIPEAKIKYIADPWQGAKEWVDSLNGPIFTTDTNDIFEDTEVNAVLICSSTDTHVKYIIEAANAQKHIFCEKPIDHDIERINAAVAAVEKNDVKFQIGFNRRFDPNFKAVKKAIVDGKIGDIRFISITSRDPGPPPIEYIKVSGGIFMDMTIHDFDMARFLANSEVEEVYTKAAVMVDPKIGEAGDFDSAAIVLTFENGAICVINNCREASYGYDQRVEVFGSKGMVDIANDLHNRAVISTKDGVVGDKPLDFFMDRYTKAYIAEVKEFINAIVSNGKLTTCAIDGLKSVEIAKAAAQSAKTGLPVKL
jgi:myo-inositol 2-dehydrogenase / D-chiro-inositol 1-dehydrogenase